MAERRMFAKTIVLSDAFLDMPLSTRCLYFTLGMLADDDGFVNNPKSIMRQCGAQEDDMKLLFAKKFLLPFESGVVVIKHWRINNYLQKDRYQPTKYLDEKNMLEVEKNGAYHRTDQPEIETMYTQEAYTQERIDKDSKGYKGVTNVTPRRTDERQTVTDAWNAAGISPIKKIMPETKRDRMLAARIREYGLEDVLAAIGKVKESAFLKGKNDRGWVVTFDWFLTPSNFQKVLEGNYADTKPQGKSAGYQRHGEEPGAEMQSAINRMLAEMEDEG